MKREGKSKGKLNPSFYHAMMDQKFGFEGELTLILSCIDFPRIWIEEES